MKNVLIIYSSKYGATQSYAEHLSIALDATCIPIKKVKKEDIQRADILIFGGSIYIGKLSILKKLSRFQSLLSQKEWHFFAVGLMDNEKNALPVIMKNNPELTKYTYKKIHYFPGVFDINKTKGIQRLLLNMMSKTLTKKHPLTDEEKALLEAIQQPKDMRDMTLTKSLISDIKESL